MLVEFTAAHTHHSTRYQLGSGSPAENGHAKEAFSNIGMLIFASSGSTGLFSHEV